MPRCLLVGFALLVATVPWRAAHAHAVLLESSPAENAVLAEAPERIELRFNEPIRPAVLRLLRASDEASVKLGSPEVTDTELRVPLPSWLSDGSYVLSYRVTSADGHPVVGSFVFAIGTSSAPASPALTAAGSEDFWRIAGVAARALWYGSLLLAAGLALFLGLLPVPGDLRPPLRRGLAWLAALGLAACLAILGATGGALHGGMPRTLLSVEPWRIALASPVAVSVAVAAPGLGILALAAGRAGRERLTLLAGALLVAASFASSGHATTAGPGWITRPALMLHALCAAYWVGAFAPLFFALRRLSRDRALLLIRAFSARAVVAVGCLLLAGTTLAALQVRTPAALIATDYGRLLLLKLALVGLLVCLGVINRLVLTPALQRRAGAAFHLRQTIAVDLALAAGVVVLTAGLGSVPPPRALAEQAAAHARAGHGSLDYAVQVTSRDHNLVVVISPARIGRNRVDLYLMSKEGQPVDAKAAELSFALPERGIEALRVDAAAIEPGRFQGRVDLPLAGAWQVCAEFLVDDFTKLPFRASILVAR